MCQCRLLLSSVWFIAPYLYSLAKLDPVKNHGIPEVTITATIEAANKFFSLPAASKIEVSISSLIFALQVSRCGTHVKQLDIHNSSNFKGYTALLGENANPKNKGDLHEGFDLGWEPEHQSNQPLRDDREMSGANVWPDASTLPGFKESILAY